ncbi:uncharacterized protein LOC142134219 isoform X1 [Mixophyes fleayi]|uniref:uncharacterized protein LOC142134219 isoform X1 n=1 Tax=Mixophyes fleayi TaxID=3061075 RepID=UPI003F4DBFF5
MSSLQGMGLAAALLAASGGVAIASWRYISARRKNNEGPDIKPAQKDKKEELGSTPVLDEDSRTDPSIKPVQKADEEEELGSIPAVYADKRADLGTSVLHADHERANQECRSVQEECKRAEPDPSALLHKGDERADSDRTPVESPVEKKISGINASPEIQVKGKASQVLVLGLDGSGKTSILNSIAANKGKLTTTPTATEGVNAICINNGNSKTEFLEIGGSEQLRPYWKMYLARALAVIFVVDSADHSRLPLAKRHLHQLIQQDSVLPLLVLANKQDLKNAYHITDIHDALALSEICENRRLFLIGTHVTKDDHDVSSGILDAKEFLAQLLSENSATIT